MILYITPDMAFFQQLMSSNQMGKKSRLQEDITLAFKQCGIEGILTFTNNSSKINIIGTKEQFEFVMSVLKTTNLTYNNRIQTKEEVHFPFSGYVYNRHINSWSDGNDFWILRVSLYPELVNTEGCWTLFIDTLKHNYNLGVST